MFVLLILSASGNAGEEDSKGVFCWPLPNANFSHSVLPELTKLKKYSHTPETKVTLCVNYV